MAQRDDSKYSNRLEDAQKARAAMLEKAKVRAEEARKKLQETAGERAAIAAAIEAERVKREEADKLVALLAEQKAARDAKYAARKDRQKKGRR